MKSSTYETFRYQDVKMCIGLLDNKMAHTCRKGLLPTFPHQNLMEVEPVVRLHLERFLKCKTDNCFDRQIGQAFSIHYSPAQAL